MSWKKEKPIEAKHIVCLNCGDNHDVFSMNGVIAVGFGSAYLEKDGKIIWSEDEVPKDADFDKFMTGEQAEALAEKDPDHDWRIKKLGPLSEGEWQRQGEKHWVLYREGMGFA